ncbi:YhgE/Pip domain-containing protein [Levilactobacillus enshiensis]|uniref:YhgE/Pip domain-containing protein n=1 Tax=Levilactobacillus enshiensis TaxID=2590213 RepID=UPI00117B6CF4|nr:ABC transporter permease [Levilactobacillus enshiensis]
MLQVFKRKNIWLTILASIFLIATFAFAQVGARSTAKVRHLPIALVVNDTGTSAHTLSQKLLRENRQTNAKIKWITVHHQSELAKGFASGRYYGAMVIHSGFGQALTTQQTYLKDKIVTAKLTALATKTPALAQTASFQAKQAQVRALGETQPQTARISLYVSQGNNATVANLLTTALPQLVTRLNQQIATKYQRVATTANLALTATDWGKLQTPIHTTLVTRNPLSTKKLSGMAPMLITIFCWIGSLIASLLNWRDHKKFEPQRTDGRLSVTSVTSQILSGTVLASAIALTIYVFTKVCYGVPIAQPIPFLLLIGFISFVFLMLQTAILDTLGLKGWPILLVIWIISMGVITFVPQMLSPFYQHAVYDWTPIRFAYDLITKQLYLQDASLWGSSFATLLGIGVAAISCMYASTLPNRKLQLD